jgi:hypothetical protein
MEGVPLLGTLRERWIFRGWDVQDSVDGCLHRGPVGEPGEGVHLQGTVIVRGGLWKWSISLYGSSVRGTWRHKRRLWKWAPFPQGGGGPSLANLEEGSYAGGLCVEEGSGMGVSQYRGLDGDLRRGGVCLSGTLRDG